MSQVGIRALEQNASAVVAAAASGEGVTITDRGRPVAQIAALPASPWQRSLDGGRLRPPKRELADLAAPQPGPELSAELAAMRVAERY